MTELEWLCGWFARQCDGDWEHAFGVTIGTLDNPGWSLRIDLRGTALGEVAFVAREREDGERWMRLWKDDAAAVFHGAGSPAMLPAMLAEFRAWASAVG